MIDIKRALEQYNSLKQEKADNERIINNIEKRIAELEEKGYKEKDSVSGGNGGIQHFSIEGFPYPRYHREKSLLILRKKRWSEIEEKLDEKISEIEEYLNSIDDSQMRRMIKYKYIEELSWQQVAERMGGGNTADGCRMAVDRYLKKQYEL
nr:MAG TPA: Protein of unknown function (DUF1492) [Caudoviricetes sp.]